MVVPASSRLAPRVGSPPGVGRRRRRGHVGPPRL